MDEVAIRLTAWGESGFVASSGVETFYETPDAEEVDNAVATMIFNAWLARAIKAAFDDEGIPGACRVPGRLRRLAPSH